MIIRLALRELWHSRFALLLQVASLAIAIAALAASSHLAAQLVGGAIPGAGCADEALQVTGTDGSDNVQDGWTPRQAKVLMSGLKSALAAQTTYGSVRILNGSTLQDIPASFVGPNFFDLLCVSRTDSTGRIVHGPFVDGAVVDQDLASKLAVPRTIISNANALAVGATTRGFKGIQYKAAPVQVWAPYSQLEAQGDVFANMDSGVIHVLIRPQANETSRALDARLDALRQAQPSLFPGIIRLQTGPALQVGGWTASKIRLVANMLSIFAWALLLLVLVNLLVYNAGRLPGTQALATTLAALGVPPAAIWLYAAIEPCVVGVFALLLGSAISLPLGYAAFAAVSSDSSVDLSGTWTTFLRAIIVGVIVAGVVIAARGRVLTRRQAPSRSRAQRLVLRLLPWLLALQVALAALTLVLAAQAAVGLLKAVPPEPNFPLSGLSVLTVNKGDTTHAEEHIALRWHGAWQSSGAPGFHAALATSQTPFLPITGYQGGIGTGGRSTQALYDYVTSDFFEVIGGNSIQAQSFDADTVSWNTSAKYEATHIVLNADTANVVMPNRSASGTSVRINHDIAHQPSTENRSAIVIGVFDDGLVGARGAVGTMELSKLSMQASVPVVYQSLTELRPDDQLYVFVRHPVGATDSQVVEAVLPALHVLLPRATISQVDDGRALFRNPLRKERSMALILGLLATATLAIGLLGMISLMTMLINSLRVELAVRYAVGSTRSTAALQVVKRLATPTLIGLVVAVAPAAFGVFLLSQTLETAGRAGLWGPIGATIALLLAAAGVLLQAHRLVMRANLMDWLRYE